MIRGQVNTPSQVSATRRAVYPGDRVLVRGFCPFVDQEEFIKRGESLFVHLHPAVFDSAQADRCRPDQPREPETADRRAK